MPSALLLVQESAEAAETLGFGVVLGVLAGALVMVAGTVWLAVRVFRLLGRLVPERIRSSHELERNLLVGIALLVSLAFSAQTIAGGAFEGAIFEIAMFGLSLALGSLITVFLPLVLLLSPAYRSELGQRLTDSAEQGFGATRWASFRGVAAITFIVLFFPILVVTIGMPAAVAYLRGRAGTYAERIAEQRQAKVRARPGERARQAAASAAQRALDQAQASLDRARTSIPTGDGGPGPLPTPTGPRRDIPSTPRPRTVPERAEERPRRPDPEPRAEPRPVPDRGPSGGAEQPRRRWWQGGGSSGARPSTPKEPKFRTRSGGDGSTAMLARKSTERDSEGKPFDMVSIEVRSSFKVPRAGSLIVRVFEVLDVTDPGRGPIAVHHRGDDILSTEGPYRDEEQAKAPSSSAQFSGTFRLPFPLLHAPYRGDRTLRARFTLHRPRSPNELLAHGWVEFPYREETLGYVEAPQVRLRTEAGIATAGFAAVVADGDVDAEEVALLEQFLAARHRHAEDGKQLADAARAALDDARMRVRSGTTARELLAQAGRDLADAGTGPRATAYELAVRIIAVDGRITEAELLRLNELAEALELDAETAATLRNRHTNVGMFEGENADPLGVPPGTPQEQRAFLMGELKKWRSVQTHPDPAKRQQAQEMIDLIAARVDELDRAGAGAS